MKRERRKKAAARDMAVVVRRNYQGPKHEPKCDRVQSGFKDGVECDCDQRSKR